MMMLTNLELIRRAPLFAMLTEEQIAAFANAVVKRRFKRGETIVEQGKKTDALFVLVNGRVRVVKADRDGHEVILAILRPGDSIGEMSLIDSLPHSATVRAEMQTDALILGRTEFLRYLPEKTSLAYVVMRGLVQRLRQADRKIETLALLDVYGRVARVLLDAAEKAPDGVLMIREKISHRDISQMVGASREMVSRVMKGLQERGLIEIQPDGSIVAKERLTSYD
ncbi:MAG: Crp/Fnr family transcriptional regulator [Burkholderiaceae bacterium]|jgi:CRP-like cAMP-binding protein|nr:Crp/Fnr family transcriptional regulator [Burkholderiaceae bacterium]